jgi:lipase maturation factor 1
VVYTCVQALPSLSGRLAPPAEFHALASIVAPFRSLNNYGLFAVMTNPRPELIFEGSDDRMAWHAYEFPHKPGALTRRPTWVAPHQPRLDWQLWFAALGAPSQNPWVIALCEHLLRGSPEVLALFVHNPFPQKPPRFIRVVRYEYHFTDPNARAATGQWWRRTPMDFYVPAVSLK